tara:strand:+ start:1084 stop:1359 length:276 start_codon:yes stop_codon:yes gene_type:complete
MSKLFNAPLHYPASKAWMWNYCIYLGPFTDSKGNNFDLGIHIGQDEISTAIVDGNEPGSYYSGDLNNTRHEHYVETKRRAIECGLIEPTEQ